MARVTGMWAMAAVGALGVCAVLTAGPITPPGGVIAATGRTLDEIFNKIPAGGAGDGRIAIAGGTSAVTISQPGSYVLTGNITGTGNLILISVDNVTLDLNGYTVTNTTTAGVGVFVNLTRSNVVVRNGTIRGAGMGVHANAACTDLLVEDLVILDCKGTGVSATSVGGSRTTVRRCTVSGTGSTTTAADGSLTITGILVGGNHVRVEDCTVRDLSYNGSGVGTLRGIVANGGTGDVGGVVSRCTISQDAATAGNGIRFFGSGVYRDNTVINWTQQFVGGTNGGGNF